MFQWAKRQLDRISSPTLDWVQVEITTHCNGSCIYCPHTIMRNRWVSRHMPIELFNELIPFLGYTDLVYLQGWGEPLLNSDFFEMVRACKARGKRVGFTTNGMLLTEDTIQTLVALQLDIIGISLAGTTARTNDRIRKGSNLNRVISHLEILHKIKAEMKSQVPAVHLAYLMLRSNFHELREILPIARKVGAQQIVASNLTLIVDPKLSAEAIFNDTERMDYYRNTLEEIKQRAAREKIVFDYHGPGLEEASVCCRENVRKACVINIEGEVVPCVLTNPVLCGNREATHGKTPRHTFKDQSFPLRGMSFGNIRNESLTRIWNKKEYLKFRDLFDPRKTGKPEQVHSKMPECCVTCYKRLGA
ncbi:MAG: radical SAM protein [Deltaproteobacteria bacterium]|nr:radical SAM protein [Deltaproteobacteria bacterium]